MRAGLTPLDAIRAATVRPAEFLGLEGETGRIERGMRADPALLAADPLADVTHTAGSTPWPRGRLLTLEAPDLPLAR